MCLADAESGAEAHVLQVGTLLSLLVVVSVVIIIIINSIILLA